MEILQNQIQQNNGTTDENNESPDDHSTPSPSISSSSPPSSSMIAMRGIRNNNNNTARHKTNTHYGNTKGHQFTPKIVKKLCWPDIFGTWKVTIIIKTVWLNIHKLSRF